MSIKELAWNKKMRTELARHGFKFDRVESHDTAPGIPDDAFLHTPTHFSGWIEVKEEADVPEKITYRPKQVPWLMDHWGRGGICMTIVHIKSGNLAIVIPGYVSSIAGADLSRVRLQPMSSTIILKRDDGWLELSKAILRICEAQKRSR